MSSTEQVFFSGGSKMPNLSTALKVAERLSVRFSPGSRTNEGGSGYPRSFTYIVSYEEPDRFSIGSLGMCGQHTLDERGSKFYQILCYSLADLSRDFIELVLNADMVSEDELHNTIIDTSVMERKLNSIEDEILQELLVNSQSAICNAILHLMDGKKVVIKLEEDADFEARSREILILLYRMMLPKRRCKIGFSTYRRNEEFFHLGNNVDVFIVENSVSVVDSKFAQVLLSDNIIEHNLAASMIAWSNIALSCDQIDLTNIYVEDLNSEMELVFKRFLQKFEWKMDKYKQSICNMISLLNLHDDCPELKEDPNLNQEFNMLINDLLKPGLHWMSLLVEMILYDMDGSPLGNDYKVSLSSDTLQHIEYIKKWLNCFGLEPIVFDAIVEKIKMEREHKMQLDIIFEKLNERETNDAIVQHFDNLLKKLEQQFGVMNESFSRQLINSDSSISDLSGNIAALKSELSGLTTTNDTKNASILKQCVEVKDLVKAIELQTLALSNPKKEMEMVEVVKLSNDVQKELLDKISISFKNGFVDEINEIVQSNNSKLSEVVTAMERIEVGLSEVIEKDNSLNDSINKLKNLVQFVADETNANNAHKFIDMLNENIDRIEEISRRIASCPVDISNIDDWKKTVLSFSRECERLSELQDKTTESANTIKQIIDSIYESAGKLDTLFNIVVERIDEQNKSTENVPKEETNEVTQNTDKQNSNQAGANNASLDSTNEEKDDESERKGTPSTLIPSEEAVAEKKYTFKEDQFPKFRALNEELNEIRVSLGNPPEIHGNNEQDFFTLDNSKDCIIHITYRLRSICEYIKQNYFKLDEKYLIVNNGAFHKFDNAWRQISQVGLSEELLLLLAEEFKVTRNLKDLLEKKRQHGAWVKDGVCSSCGGDFESFGLMKKIMVCKKCNQTKDY